MGVFLIVKHYTRVYNIVKKNGLYQPFFVFIEGLGFIRFRGGEGIINAWLNRA